MFPPMVPPRFAMHDCEWHAQTFLAVLIEKLSVESLELCVGNGQRPRKQPGPDVWSLTP